MMKELWSSQVLFYSQTDHFGNFVELIYDFDFEIEKEKMQQALDTTIQRYPYFKVKLVRHGEECVLDDNDKPLVIYEDVEYPTLKPEENNEYLLRICVKGKKLGICFSHAMADGRAIMPFIKTLLHYYWHFAFNEESMMPDVRLSDSVIPEEETAEPKPPASELSLAPAAKKEAPPAYQLPEEKDKDGNQYVFHFTMNADAFIRYSHEMDGSPNALIALFTSRAVHALHPDAENIIAGVSVDFRAAMHAKQATGCHIGLLYVPYMPKKMDAMDITTLATCYRGSIIMQSDPELLLDNLNKSQQFYAYLKGMKTMQEKVQLCSMLVNQASVTDTFTVSYIGKEDYGKIGAHIVRGRTIVDGHVTKLCIEIMNVNDKFFITLTQNMPTDIYVKALMKQLEEADIACTDYAAYKMPAIKVADILDFKEKK